MDGAQWVSCKKSRTFVREAIADLCTVADTATDPNSGQHARRRKPVGRTQGSFTSSYPTDLAQPFSCATLRAERVTRRVSPAGSDWCTDPRLSTAHNNLSSSFPPPSTTSTVYLSPSSAPSSFDFAPNLSSSSVVVQLHEEATSSLTTSQRGVLSSSSSSESYKVTSGKPSPSPTA